MTESFNKAAVLGATGPTGLHLVPVLLEQGVAVRVVSRSAENLESCFAALDVERHAADLLDPEATSRAVAGCDVAFYCVGLPGELMDRHPVAARNVTAGSGAAGARCVDVTGYWGYLPLVETPLSERHPRTGGSPWMRYRREAEDIFLEAGAAVVQLPDFYGPRVHTSTLQQPLAEAAEGKAMNWMGAADTAREYAFVPDAMATVARLAARPEAYGERWIVPGAGALTGRRTAEIAGEVLGRRVALRTAGLWTLRLVSLFNRPLRGFLQVVPDYLKPISYDAGKLEGLLGAQPQTPYEEGIRQTLEWIAGRRSAASTAAG